MGATQVSAFSTLLVLLSRLEPGHAAKSLFLCLTLFVSSGASASDWCDGSELNINGVSKHFYQTKYSTKHGWNELNVGVGLTCHLQGIERWNDEVEVGVYKNSHKDTSFYAGYGIYYPANPALSVGLKVVIASGYRSHSHGYMVGVLPTVKIKLFDSVNLNLSIALQRKSFFFANLGFQF